MKSLSSSRAVILSLFLSTLGVSAFTFTFPLLAEEKQIGGIYLGSAFSGYFLVKLILAPAAGQLADRLGIRPLLLTASFFAAVIPCLYLFDPSSANLYLIQFALGFAGGILKPLGMAVIGADANQEQQAKLFGSYNLLFNLALMAGPLTAGLLYLVGPTTPLLLFLCATQLLAALMLFFSIPKELGLTAPVGGTAKDAQPTGIAAMVPLMFAVAGRTLGIAVLITLYPLLLKQVIIGERFVLAVFFGIPTLFTCLTLPLARLWNNRQKRTWATLVGMVISGCGLLLISIFPSPAGFFLGGALLGTGAGISAPAAMALAVGLSEKKGSITGWFHLAANMGFVAGPLFAGVMVQRGAELTGPLQGAGLLGIVCCVPLLLQKMQHQFGKHIPFLLPGSVLAVLLLVLSLGFRALTLQEPEEEYSRFRYANIAMGTIVRMTIEHEDEQQADRAAKSGMSLIHQLQQDFDHRNIQGSIGRINEAAGREPVVITDRASALIGRALSFCAKTDGVFDISIGAVSRNVEYFRDRPTDKQRELVDFRKIVFDPTARQVYLPKEEMALDLGGLAKGTVIDAVVAELKKQGISVGIVEAGGDFFCFGQKKWRCGLQHPRKNELLGIIEVQNKAVCGSGDYYQFVMSEENGKRTRKHHIIDIAAGTSAKKSIGVTTVAATTELADALATTLMIMGPNLGRRFLKQHYPDAAALWVEPDLTMTATDNFPPLLPAGE
ncbi:MAG: thiamine biosynthesis protein ApbE [Desulfobulbus propionicus]|nr:MAG: thiamine biosynthesis protein ApbE [Desulfobulbus propionicus]